MKEKKGVNNRVWLYVLALALVIVLLMVFFGNDVSFSPRQKASVKKVASIGLNDLQTGNPLDLSTGGGYIMASTFMEKDGVGLDQLNLGEGTTDSKITEVFTMKGGNNDV